MKDKKTVTIVTDNGEKEAEILNAVNIEGKGNYIIYLLDGEFYGAKYEDNGTDTDLITDLSDEEKDILNKFFEAMEEK